SDVDLHGHRPRRLAESERSPRNDPNPRGHRGVPRARPGLLRMGALPKTQGGATAGGDADVDVGSATGPTARADAPLAPGAAAERARSAGQDRKSTRLNSSHDQISY